MSDRVYDALVVAIRDLKLPPGSVVSESELSNALDVSRTPVREAVSRLVDAGLLFVVPQVGTRVAPIVWSEVVEAQFVRETLEVAAVRLACDLSEPDWTEMDRALAAQVDAVRRDDLDAFITADEGFHRQIFAQSGVPGAWDVVYRVKLQLDRVRRMAPTPISLADLYAEHRAIADAVQAGDADTGSELMALHLRHVFGARELFEPGPA